MKFKFFILLIGISINYIFGKKPQLLSVSVYENTFKKDTYNITLINPNYVKILKNPSKLAYITDINQKDLIILTNYTKYYNKIWLFFITDIKQLEQIIEKKYENDNILITGLLIPESLSHQNIDMSKVEKFPLFTVNEDLNKTLINYDIRKNKKNVYFTINYTENVLIVFFIVFSSIGLISAIVIGVVWNILEKKVGPDYIFNYHERIKYVLCSHFFISVTLIFKTVSLMRTENYELTVAVEVSLYLCVSFFRSILWFLIYLISCGWIICFQELPTNEQRKMYKIFIVIAIFFWIDDILDKYCNKLWVFNISEIKNIILFTVITVLTVRNINKNIASLNRKYNFAMNLLQDYADGISEKIKLLKYLKYQIFSYIPLYLIVLFINKFILSDYDNPIILLYTYLIPDFILEFSFMYLMRPRIVPIFFGIDLGGMFNEVEGKTYICTLPKYEDFNDEFVKEKITYDNYDENEKIPIIVFGPENNKNNFSINDEDIPEYANTLDLEINKYFSSIKVGYIEKEE